MRLFGKKQVIKTSAGLQQVAPPLRGRGTYKVRRFSGMYVCGCQVNQLKMIALVNEGHDPSVHMFCDIHNMPILYHEEPEVKFAVQQEG
jgi:hypothetical protein